MEFLEGEAEEEGEPEQQGKVRHRRYRHGRSPFVVQRRDGSADRGEMSAGWGCRLPQVPER
jgi:hypothetical protein